MPWRDAYGWNDPASRRDGANQSSSKEERRAQKQFFCLSRFSLALLTKQKLPRLLTMLLDALPVAMVLIVLAGPPDARYCCRTTKIRSVAQRTHHADQAARVDHPISPDNRQTLWLRDLTL